MRAKYRRTLAAMVCWLACVGCKNKNSVDYSPPDPSKAMLAAADSAVILEISIGKEVHRRVGYACHADNDCVYLIAGRQSVGKDEPDNVFTFLRSHRVDVEPTVAIRLNESDSTIPAELVGRINDKTAWVIAADRNALPHVNNVMQRAEAEPGDWLFAVGYPNVYEGDHSR